MELLKISFSATILIVAIVIIRALVINKLPKKTFLVLWGVALCRLLIPFSLPSQFSFYTLANKIQGAFMETPSQPITPITLMNLPETWITSNTINPTVAGISPAFSITPAFLLAVIWLAGMATCALFFLIVHLRCRREYNTALPIENEFIGAWLREHPTKRHIQIKQSDKINAPLAYGILAPIILLPKTMDWDNRTQLEYVLAHELVHIKRFDILTKWLSAAALCVHWFNPFVWVMYILASRDIELSCDETVILSFGETAKSSYALALIGLEEKRSRLSPLCNNFSKNAIEERIRSIMKMKKASFIGVVLACVLVLGVTTAFATSAASNNDNSLSDSETLNEESSAEQFETRPVNGSNGQFVGDGQFTQEEYDLVMSQKLDGYEKMTVSDFNSKLLDMANNEANEELYRNAMERVIGGINETDKNAPFILNTLQASVEEIHSTHAQSFGSFNDPTFNGAAFKEFGVISKGEWQHEWSMWADYSISYKIMDETKLTIGERDHFLQEIMKGMQAYVDSKSQDELMNTDAIKVALTDELNRLAKEQINENIQITGVELLGIS